MIKLPRNQQWKRAPWHTMGKQVHDAAMKGVVTREEVGHGGGGILLLWLAERVLKRGVRG